MGIGPGGGVVEDDGVAADDPGELVVAGGEGRDRRAVVGLLDRADERGGERRRIDDPDRRRGRGAGQGVVLGIRAADGQARDAHGDTASDVLLGIGSGGGVVEDDGVAADDAGELVVAGGERRDRRAVVGLLDRADERGGERRRIDDPDRRGGRGAGQGVVLGIRAADGQARDAHGDTASDVLLGIGSGGGVVEDDGVAADDAGELVVAGGEGRHRGAVVDLLHCADERGGERRRIDDPDRRGGRAVDGIVAGIGPGESDSGDAHRDAGSNVLLGVGSGSGIVQTDIIVADHSGEVVVRNGKGRDGGSVVGLLHRADERGVEAPRSDIEGAVHVDEPIGARGVRRFAARGAGRVGPDVGEARGRRGQARGGDRNAGNDLGRVAILQPIVAQRIVRLGSVDQIGVVDGDPQDVRDAVELGIEAGRGRRPDVGEIPTGVGRRFEGADLRVPAHALDSGRRAGPRAVGDGLPRRSLVPVAVREGAVEDAGDAAHRPRAGDEARRIDVVDAAGRIDLAGEAAEGVVGAGRGDRTGRIGLANDPVDIAGEAAGDDAAGGFICVHRTGGEGLGDDATRVDFPGEAAGGVGVRSTAQGHGPGRPGCRDRAVDHNAREAADARSAAADHRAGGMGGRDRGVQEVAHQATGRSRLTRARGAGVEAAGRHGSGGPGSDDGAPQRQPHEPSRIVVPAGHCRGRAGISDLAAGHQSDEAARIGEGEAGVAEVDTIAGGDHVRGRGGDDRAVEQGGGVVTGHDVDVDDRAAE